MGKNKRRQLLFKDQMSGLEAMVDSQEELDFFAWCEEAKRLGIVTDYQYQPKPFQLFEGASWRDAKGKTKCLLREHMYTADFMLKFCPKRARALAKFFKVPYEHLEDDEVQVYADVKGAFQRSDGGRSFSLNQKWVLQKHGIYVQKTVPRDFFAVCGCPQQCFLTQKTKKPRKMFAGMKSISDAVQAG